MKKYTKFLILLFFMATMIVLAGGCGGQVETYSEVKVDEKWSGTRTVYAQFTRTELRSEMDLTLTGLQKIIRNSCPEELEWKRTSSGSTYRFTFTMEFTSLEDYQNKIKNILESKNGDKIKITQPEGLYQEGFSIEENFVSSDLLGWLKNAIRKEEKVSASSIEDIFEETSSKLIYDGKTINLGTQGLKYGEIHSVEFNKISFFTAFNPERRMKRLIEFRMNMDVSEQKKEEIKQHFTGLLPEGAQENWQEEGDQVIYQATIQNADQQQIIGLTSALMQAEPVWSETESNDGRFQFVTSYQETIDLSQYISEDQETIPVAYYIKDFSDGMVEEDNLEVYELIYEGETKTVQAEYSLTHTYQIAEIHVNTEVGWKDKYKRNISLQYALVPMQKEQDTIVGTLQQAANGTSEVSSSSEDGKFTISVQHSGSAQSVTQAFANVFASESKIGYNQDFRGLFRFSVPYVFEEEVRFDQFLPQGSKPVIYYHTNFLNGEQISLSDMKDPLGAVSADGKAYDQRSVGTNLGVTVVTIQKSYLPVFLIVIMVVIFVTILIIIYKVVKDKKERKKEEDPWADETIEDEEEEDSYQKPLDSEEEKKADQLQQEIEQSLAAEVQKTFEKKESQEPETPEDAESSNAQGETSQKPLSEKKKEESAWAKPKN